MLLAIGDKTKAGIMTIPALQDVMRRAVNLRSDLRDRFDHQMEAVAKRFNLATRREMKTLRRHIRELENQVQGLEGQLTQERQRAERAEISLTEAIKSSREAEAKARKASEQVIAPKVEVLTLEIAGADAKPEGEEADKPATKRTARAKKKAESEEGG